MPTQRLWCAFASGVGITHAGAVVHHLKPHTGDHERRQLAVIRSMSLNQTASDPRTLNGFAKLETKARSAIAKVGADDLIARPQYVNHRQIQS